MRTARFLAQYFFKKFLYIFNKRLPAIKARYAHSFPAIHLKKMDSFDYLFNFSSELLTLGLALVLVVLNLVAFGLPGIHKENLADQSLAAKFLAIHPELNNKLYVHNSAVKTTVVAGSNFAATAYAADEGLSSNSSGDSDDSSDTEFESVITKPPVDPKDLLQKQITVYKTEGGDTFSSVAKKFGTCTNTLAWSNGLLPGTVLKPGWFLIIPIDCDTIIHKTTATDSIPGLAKYFHVSEDAIINANALEDAGDIESGIYLYIPKGTVVPPPTPAPKKGSTSNGGSGSIRIPLYTGSNVFPFGQCTWYVATQVKVTWRGNAGTWLRGAAGAGKTITSTPKVGYISVTPDSRYGHVAMVRAVYPNGTMLLEDYNYSGKRAHGTHIENISHAKGFIVP